MIREKTEKYIRSKISNMKSDYIDLTSREIHEAIFGPLTSSNNRTPPLCTAMYKCMRNDDEILHTTPSGRSSTIKIRYFKKNHLGNIDDNNEIENIEEEEYNNDIEKNLEHTNIVEENDENIKPICHCSEQNINYNSKFNFQNILFIICLIIILQNIFIIFILKLFFDL